MKFLNSFKYAIEGIVFSLKSQKHMKFHIASAILAVCLSFYFDISNHHWLWITLSICLVFVAELFNTAIESLTDLVSKDYNKLAKHAKDCAAGGVLIAAIFSILVATIIFSKYLL